MKIVYESLYEFKQSKFNGANKLIENYFSGDLSLIEFEQLFENEILFIISPELLNEGILDKLKNISSNVKNAKKKAEDWLIDLSISFYTKSKNLSDKGIKLAASILKVLNKLIKKFPKLGPKTKIVMLIVIIMVIANLAQASGNPELDETGKEAAQYLYAQMQAATEMMQNDTGESSFLTDYAKNLGTTVGELQKDLGEYSQDYKDTIIDETKSLLDDTRYKNSPGDTVEKMMSQLESMTPSEQELNYDKVHMASNTSLFDENPFDIMNNSNSANHSDWKEMFTKYPDLKELFKDNKSLFHKANQDAISKMSEAVFDFWKEKIHQHGSNPINNNQQMATELTKLIKIAKASA